MQINAVFQFTRDLLVKPDYRIVLVLQNESIISKYPAGGSHLTMVVG